MNELLTIAAVYSSTILQCHYMTANNLCSHARHTEKSQTATQARLLPVGKLLAFNINIVLSL